MKIPKSACLVTGSTLVASILATKLSADEATV